jgi:hypothetical protein
VSRQQANLSRPSLGRSDPDPILRAGLVLALVLVTAQTVAQLVDFGFFDLRIAVIDANRHASLFGAASLLANGAAAIVAWSRGTSGPRRPWQIAAALIVAVLAIRFADVGSGGASRFVLLLPIVGTLLVLLWRLTSRDPYGPRAVVRAGLCLLVFSYVVHVVGPRIVADLGYSVDSWPYQVKGVLKHDAEFGGWILLATGLLASARPVLRVRTERRPALTRRRAAEHQ